MSDEIDVSDAFGDRYRTRSRGSELDQYVTVKDFRVFADKVLKILAPLRKDPNEDSGEDDDKGVVPPKRNEEAVKADVRNPWGRDIATPTAWAQSDGLSRDHVKALGPDTETQGDGTGPDLAILRPGRAREAFLRCPVDNTTFAAGDNDGYLRHVREHVAENLGRGMPAAIAKDFHDVMNAVDSTARNRSLRAELLTLKKLVKESPPAPAHLQETAERWRHLRSEVH